MSQNKWTCSKSRDGKQYIIIGPYYGQVIYVNNDDVEHDQEPLALYLTAHLNESAYIKYLSKR